MSVAALRGWIGGAVILLLWEGLARGLHLPSYTLPAVSEIMATVWTQRATLLVAGGTTLLEAAAGYLLGSAIGIALAMLLASVHWCRAVLMPPLLAINSVPVAAFSPLVLLWFGIGMSSKIVLVALAVGFTVFLNALAGFDRVDRRSVDLLRSFGAGPGAVLWRLRLPTALPLIATGMRVATTRAMIVAIVTEMLGAYAGLGWVVYGAVTQIDFVQVWAAIFVASVISLVCFWLVGAAERRWIFWR